MKLAAAPGGVTSHPSHPLDPPLISSYINTKHQRMHGARNTVQLNALSANSTLLGYDPKA